MTAATVARFDVGGPPVTEGVGATDYQPGACNIGPAEIARRRRSVLVSSVAALALYLGLIAIAAPDLVRLLVALPAASAAISWLQVRERFCVAFGIAGVFNFGPVGELGSIHSAEARRADRRKVASMVARGSAIGLLIGIVAVLVP
ncbi:MAG: hypothetical protein ACHQ02_07995 [Candidatus Limnocylindrales bacterium]|jgi:uncharacterized membrane protein (DUF485 family)